MADGLDIRKWYFGVNQRGLETRFGLIRAAVNSCLANTPLAPHCLYVGANTRLLPALRRLGVTVIAHTPSFKQELELGYAGNYAKFAGHWLRADLPLIESSDPFVLYTDIDVLFLKWRPELLSPPTFLAAAPENRISETRKFNSGVMVLNIDNMRRELPPFHAAIRARLMNGFKYPSHDQRSFNDFFRDRFDRLTPLMNWKPYWGRNDQASIVHFHGPKPAQIPLIREGGCRDKPTLLKLWESDPAAYDYYCRLWREYNPVPHPAA